MKTWTQADTQRLLQLRNEEEPGAVDRKGRRIVLPTADERAVRREGEAFVKAYAGRNSFILKLRAELLRPGVRYLTANQLAIVQKVRTEEATGVRSFPTKNAARTTSQSAKDRSRQRGERKQREAAQYKESQRVVRRTDNTIGVDS